MIFVVFYVADVTSVSV